MQIDECKMRKLKYGGVHSVCGACIFGGVNKTNEKRIFFNWEVPNKNAETHSEVIRKHIVPGSIVITDCWKGYTRIILSIMKLIIVKTMLIRRQAWEITQFKVFGMCLSFIFCLKIGQIILGSI